ncbi:Peroxisomal membrane protein PMP47B [Vanrija pseudolonga]|uniref:Peroxisomal membrane protein PMP47B n=1 Tax=Vanrija pseudolonga TaxID=143232 RepID=A0AAF0Y7Q3_9TREE|nr:Peroxisomal membrane protein PMP47B [Vanrija pseudolonga]
MSISDSAIHALAGAVGGSVSMALTYPLVNLSTRAAVTTKKEDLSIGQALVKTVKEQGIGGLYSGLGSSLFGISLTNAAAYEETRAWLIKRRTGPSANSALTTGEGIVAGLIAGSFCTIVTNPIWTVQAYQSTRAVASADGEKKSGPSAVESFKAIIKADGVKGLWRGIGPALILVINPVIQYTTFERMVSALLTWRAKRAPAGSKSGPLGRSALTDWDLFVLGALSKLIATGSSYPILVVKSRLQAATHKYSSSLKAIVQILKTEGISGLYAGLGPKLLQSALTAAFLFVAQRRIYEAVKSFVNAAASKRAAVRA